MSGSPSAGLWGEPAPLDPFGIPAKWVRATRKIGKWGRFGGFKEEEEEEVWSDLEKKRRKMRG